MRAWRPDVVAMSRLVAVTILFLGSTALVTVVGQRPASTVTVDCTRGESITQAVSGGSPGQGREKFNRGTDPDAPLIVMIRGTCNENVDIRRDKVTLQGESPGSGIEVSGGTALLLWQVRHINLVELTITSSVPESGNGIYLPQQTTANMRNVRVDGFQNGFLTQMYARFWGGLADPGVGLTAGISQKPPGFRGFCS